jgi:integrase/recombinase XerD
MRTNHLQSKQLRLLEVADMFLREEKRKVRKDIRPSTYRTYEIRNKNLIKYLMATGKKDIKLDDVNLKFIDQMERYFLYDRGVSYDHARRVISQLKQVINYAHLYEFTSKNIIQGYKLKRSKPKELVHLTEQELDRLMHITIATPKIRQAADLFKFQCWTGLAYGDLTQFSIKNLERDKDGDWISYTRIKNGYSEAILPLLKEAEDILKKYDYQLPYLDNSKYNLYLKELADIMGIQKRLTTHVGRKTFGMIMLNCGVSLEVVSKMLGHKSVKTTQDTYAQVLKKRIAKDMKKYFPERPLNTGKLIVLR